MEVDRGRVVVIETLGVVGVDTARVVGVADGADLMAEGEADEVEFWMCY